MFRTSSKILAVRLDNLGDLLQTFPSFYNLYRQHKKNVYFLVNKNWQSLLELTPFAKQAIYFDRDNLADTKNKIVAQAFDYVINFSFEKNSKQYLKQLTSHIKKRFGAVNSIKSIFYFNQYSFQSRSKSIKNEASYLLDLAEQFNKKILKNNIATDYKIKLVLNLKTLDLITFQKNIKKKYRLKNDLVIITVGSGQSALNYNEKIYIESAEDLLNQGYSVLITGSSKFENDFANRAMAKLKKLKNQPVNLCGKLNFNDFIKLIAISKLVIGPSSGALHLASALNVPYIGLYTPIKVQSKTRWAPYKNNGIILQPNVNCPAKYRCLGQKCPYYLCLDQIKQADIGNATKKILNG